MSAVLDSFEARLEPMTLDRLDAVCAIEQRAYSHPWSRGNFTDSLAVGYHCQTLVAGPEVLGYFIAMKGVDEVHLLNITVAPEYQRQGWAPLMLAALRGWSRGQGAMWLWLEVRQSNQRALDIYKRQGFRQVGLRKGYYPAFGQNREDAIVMSLRLDERESAWGGLK
ncbi:ribosomal protein S18-alanine N-acetyltransferase [Variovorax dokdonensis]|uniref:[Ribosomal protein bS18]-alanine N-acetyltransferase n=1 Tax=Variovorax dokdonensis TaxID=344883 RepID=A0ABT7NA12_9BURK|nr:ribosomal protein S18-alanine N-acetyltransferase [Variovorax dokdonensis]MDM0044710.1 ribosomal protein S18-alanine N-acetyltransferase [Variovorax dokdonensis]